MKALLFFILTFCTVKTFAQKTETDSLKKTLDTISTDLGRIRTYESLSYAYLSSYPDSALQYALKGLQLAKEIKSIKGQAICINAIGNVYFHVGDNAKALEMYLNYLQLKESLNDYSSISVAYYNIAGVYTEEKDYRNALSYLIKATDADEKNKDSAAYLYDLYSLGSVYARMEMNDSALYYMNKAYGLVQKLDDRNMIGAVLNTFGEIYFDLKNYKQATGYYRQSLPYAEAVKDNEVVSANYFGLAKVHKVNNMLDSAVYYARKAYDIAYEGPFYKQALEMSSFISDVFRLKNKYDSAYHYQELSIAIKDSLFNAAQVAKVQNLRFEEQQRQQAIITQKIEYESTIKLFIVIGVSAILLIIALALWRNNNQKRKTNKVLENTLAELKLTQSQLIQSEKMASLGELTAGIAHEIQNPVNFITNFSEVNKELLEELKHEINNVDDDNIKILADDIIANEEKIYQHGRRADAIVKSMLQHSVKNTGKKEQLDINKLVNEYLRLSYHSFRSKDNDFNVQLKTNFDDAIEDVNIVAQDVGQALINIFNNAFYEVGEKKKTAGGNYKPMVAVTTQKTEDGIEINISDNGNGINQNIINKIFQPFFTTKPTGKGIGLGLSLAYDIIVKEYSGNIAVKSTPGKHAEGDDEVTIFTILLPFSTLM